MLFGLRERLKILVSVTAQHSHGILRSDFFEGRQILYVLVIEPLHLKVQVHIVSTLAQTVLLVL